MRDLRQVVNVLLHRPWYTGSILTVIAVGFALLASTLAVVDGVLFKPLGYPGEHQLAAIQVSSSLSRSRPTVTPDDVAAWASAIPMVAFTGFRAYGVPDSLNVCAAVQPNFFDVIGVRPAIGGFAPEHFQGPRPAIEPRILTYESFQFQLDGDPTAIGRTVITNPSAASGYTVVGVMPRGFVFPYDFRRVGCLTAYMPRRFGNFDSISDPVVARIPPGIAITEVRQRVLATAASRTTGARPASPADPVIDRVNIQPLARALGMSSRPLFSALLAAAGLLLVIAALNASSLMAARSLDRAHELAVRRALGATLRDIGRLLLAESALLVGAGAAVGLVLATPFLRVVVPLLPDNVVLFRQAAIDWRVIGFTALAAAALAVLSAIWLVRRALANNTRLEPARQVTEPAKSTSRRAVVAAQVALALMLTVAGSLLVGSLLSVYAQKQPITTKGVILITADFLDDVPRTDLPHRVVRVNAVLDRLRTVPGVEAAAVVTADFLNGGYAPPFFVAPPTARQERTVVQGHPVTADYYRVVEPQLLAGRLPTATEWVTNEPVVVIGEGVASRFWPNAPAVGQTLTYAPPHGESRTFTVVGVVKDVRWFAWDAAEVQTIYSPFSLTSKPQPTFLIRSATDTGRVTADVLRAMAEADPMLRPQRPALLQDLFVDSVRARRLQAWLFGSFAAASLFVVGIGILGQLAISTARRTREVGIRMTCGATGGHIVRLIVREQLVPVVAGVIAGGLGAAWAVRFVNSYLYQLTSSDARVWAAAIGLILFTAAAGALIPALRASRTDPTAALRAE